VAEEEGQKERKKGQKGKKYLWRQDSVTGNVTNTALQQAAVANMVKRA